MMLKQLLAAWLLAAATLLSAGDYLLDLERKLDRVEFTLLASAATKSGSASQQTCEKLLAELISISRDVQGRIRKPDLKRTINASGDALILQDVFSKLHQGLSRPQRGVSLKKTTLSDFRRSKRSDLNKIKKSGVSPAEAREQETMLYEVWIDEVKEANYLIAERVKSRVAKEYYEKYIAAVCHLRLTIRKLQDSGLNFKY